MQGSQSNLLPFPLEGRGQGWNVGTYRDRHQTTPIHRCTQCLGPCKPDSRRSWSGYRESCSPMASTGSHTEEDPRLALGPASSGKQHHISTWPVRPGLAGPGCQRNEPPFPGPRRKPSLPSRLVCPCLLASAWARVPYLGLGGEVGAAGRGMSGQGGPLGAHTRPRSWAWWSGLPASSASSLAIHIPHYLG